MDEPKSLKLTDLQLVLIEELGRKEEKLATMYSGYLHIISQTTNPDRLALAAHSLRELIEKLPPHFDAKMTRTRFGDKFRPLKVHFRKVREKSQCWKNGRWEGVLDKFLISFLKKFEELIIWDEEQNPTKDEETSRFLRNLDARKLPLSPTLEKEKIAVWRDLYYFFEKVSHHGSAPSEVAFRERVETLESILVNYFRPRTFEDFDDIDVLLAKYK